MSVIPGIGEAEIDAPLALVRVELAHPEVDQGGNLVRTAGAGHAVRRPEEDGNGELLEGMDRFKVSN